MDTISAQQQSDILSSDDDVLVSAGPQVPATQVEPDSGWLVDLLSSDLICDEDFAAEFDDDDYYQPTAEAPTPSIESVPQERPAARLFGRIGTGPDGKQLELTTSGLTHVDIYLDDEPFGSLIVCDGEPTIEPFSDIPDGSVIELWAFADDELVTSRSIKA